ncbi:MAG: AAA family ATPase [Gemmataceae bacterium]
MIPRRVRLKGFLSYRDEQELDFGGGCVWMLSGPNGSGKSSVFDAVTYSLFGHHRGGSRDGVELINKSSDDMSVEFEFAADGKMYRARRTLKRNRDGSAKSSQMLYQESGSHWEQVPDTGKKVEFDRWVQEHVGLSYETFTSSVLLLQGKAEKLLDSAAKARFEVLASIVDLERFGRLHELADEERKNLVGQLQQIKNRLEAMPGVDVAEIDAVRVQIVAAEEARQQCESEHERRLQLKSRAEEWTNLQRRIAEFRVQEEQALGLVTEAETIEKAAARLKELRTNLPHLEQAIKCQSRIAEAERKTQEYELAHKAAADQLDAVQRDLAQGREKVTHLDRTLAEAELEQEKTVTKASALAESLSSVKRYEDQVRHRDQLAMQMAAKPADLQAQTDQLARESDELGVFANALPHLSRIVSDRESLQRVQSELKKSETERDKIAEDGLRLKADCEAQEKRVQTLSADRRRADEEAAAAEAMYRQAQEQFDIVMTMEGATLCRACGQPLTAGHLAQERSRREAALDAATKHREQTERVRQAASTALTAAEELFRKLEAKRTNLRSDYAGKQEQCKNLTSESERLQKELFAAYEALPPPHRSKVSPASPSDWTVTKYPSSGELEPMRSQVARLGSVRRAFEGAQKELAQLTLLRAQHGEAERLALALRKALPGDPEQIRRQHVSFEADLQAIKSRLAALKKELAESRAEAEKLATRQHELEKSRQSVAGEIRAIQIQQGNDRENLKSAYAALPESWRTIAERGKLSDRSGLKGELETLEAEKTEERAAALNEAKANMSGLTATLNELRSQEATFPADTRQAVPVAAMAVAEAKQALSAADKAMQELRNNLHHLEARRDARAQLEAEKLTLDGELTQAQILAELLDRNHLQLHLIRQAEKQIVSFANAVLDRLSSGELCLRLRGGPEDEPERALELEAYNRVTGKDAINVAFLSGSQRFRVAVSLALGIGQFASRRHRPIESVIVDEGFGCLDRLGRQAMIQELQNLRGQLQCVLLVSHQEEFADAFANTYHFELEDGASKVTRAMR